jgi:hypothetical protein
MLDPISVLLKFGFLLVLYLFLLWVARSALRDLRGGGPEASRDRGFASGDGALAPPPDPDATSMHAPQEGIAPSLWAGGEPVLRVERSPGLPAGAVFDLEGGAVLGRGEEAEIQLEDPFASTRHARISFQGALPVLEDLGSTNGTWLNDEPLRGPQPLHPGDVIRIGDTELTYAPPEPAHAEPWAEPRGRRRSRR